MNDMNYRLLAKTYEGARRTEFYIEAPFTPGVRSTSDMRHLIARYDDGRPEFATAIPNDWLDEQILLTIDPDLRSPPAVSKLKH